MKIIMPILCLLVVLGVVYGAAKVGILPAQQWADKNPNLAPVLRSLHLATAAKKKSAPIMAAKADPAAQALADGQKQLAADRARFAAEQAAWEAHKNGPPAPNPGGVRTILAPPGLALAPGGAERAAGAGGASSAPVPPKLSAIYAAMSPDDLARVLGKLPDPAVTQTLLSLDPKKAGKILAALPDARAARLTQEMARAATSPAPAQTASAL